MRESLCPVSIVCGRQIRAENSVVLMAEKVDIDSKIIIKRMYKCKQVISRHNLDVLTALKDCFVNYNRHVFAAVRSVISFRKNDNHNTFLLDETTNVR